jgi:hypothetical protein
VLQVEEVFENLCVLTHHHDHFQHLSGTIIKGTTHGDEIQALYIVYLKDK